jgi:hypothetical protein
MTNNIAPLIQQKNKNKGKGVGGIFHPSKSP